MSLKNLAPAAFVAAFGLTWGNAATAGEFDGVTVNVLTFTGPQIAEPLQRRAPDFEKLTGAHVNVVTVPFSELYQKILTDWTAGTNSIDAAVYPSSWMVDFADGGLLEDIGPRMEKDKDLQADDIVPFFDQSNQMANGKHVALNLDGDFHMMYYRTDVAKELGLSAPKTWDDYLAFAKAANGKDLNGDGKADFGSCISKKRGAQSYWFIYDVAASFLQSKGTSQGIFFDTNDFKPLVNNEGFAEALRIFNETTKYGPPDELNMDVGDTRNLFVSGQCALSLDWGDIGALAIDNEKSNVIDKVGAAILPGSTKVVDRETGKLVACDADTCPYATDGVNHTPFAAYGGHSASINAKVEDKVKDAAYAFFSYMSQPAQSNVDVTIGKSGFNPYRKSQFASTDLWVKAGMSEEAAKNYLGAIQDSLNSPNMGLDMRIPNNQKYMQVVLDTAIARLLAGEIDIPTTMQTVEDGWLEITEEAGFDTQLDADGRFVGVE
jgi:multiple sugar transport system substrate-binding protein